MVSDASPLRIVLHDYGAYPFTLQLAQELGRRGHQVHYLYSASVAAPNVAGGFSPDPTDNVLVEGVPLSRPIRKQKFVRRLLQEREFGRRLVAAVKRSEADVVISADAPLETQSRLQAYCRREGIPLVYWVQDLYGLAAHRLLRRRIPLVGELVGRHYRALERRLVGQSDGVVLIAEHFAEALGLDPGASNVMVAPNWAPLPALPRTPRSNPWARDHDLDSGLNFLYAGTLGMKHDPGLLLHLAAAVADPYDARVIVISEGDAAAWLEREAGRRGLGNLRVLPFQPSERLPDVLASGDVLVALLEPEAGSFSVPSKILTYLCAGRPILSSMPQENLAAHIVDEARAGLVVAPGDHEAFLSAAARLAGDPDLRSNLGAAGREYAEATFDMDRIGDEFEEILERSLESRSRADERPE